MGRRLAFEEQDPLAVKVPLEQKGPHLVQKIRTQDAKELRPLQLDLGCRVGSGVVSERTGIVLHNRLYLERLDDDPRRGLLPGMRPFHTLCPALVVGRRGCDMAIATPGDHGQPQTIYQVLRHVFVDSIPIQDAIERPRLRHDQEKVVMVEDRAPAGWTDDLQAAGYSICDVGSWSRLMGGVNAVHRLSENVWSAGADPRRSSYAVTGGS